jgi:hypothetical protein
MVSKIREKALNDDRQIGRESAPPLELRQDGVVILDELELDPGREVFDVFRLEVLMTACRSDQAIDQGQIRDEQILTLVQTGPPSGYGIRESSSVERAARSILHATCG